MPAAFEQRLNLAVAVREKGAFQHGGVAAGPDHLLGRPFTRKQPKAVDNDRFARPGLSGEEVQSGPELDFQLPDERKIADSQQLQHVECLVEGNAG